MDDGISDLLASWDVPHEVIENFTSNGITIEILRQLTTENLKELCPHLGTRIKIQQKIAELVTSCELTESLSTKNSESVILSLDDISFSELIPATSTTAHTNVVPSPRTFPDFDLRTLLQTSPGGSSIIKYYETYGHLDSTKRSQLTDVIIKHIYTHIVHHRITYEEYNILAAKIITVFPKEETGTYFTKPISKHQSFNGRSTLAKGKLVDKVRNLLHKYGDRKRPSDRNSEYLPASKKTAEDLQNNLANEILWLNNNTEPWDEVVDKWKATFQIRKESDYRNIHHMFREWPILNDPRSETLINIDFDNLYPDKGLNFYLNWDVFFQKLIKVMPTNAENVLKILKSLPDIEDDAQVAAQIYVLGHLIPPKGRLTKKIKYTTQESIDTIFVCVENAGDIDHVIEEQKQKALAKKLPVQPYLVLHGSITDGRSPLLIIDDIKYTFKSQKKAFDTLFKAYHVFNARYPNAGDHLYLIIQRCVYKIETKYDNVVPYIKHILNL